MKNKKSCILYLISYLLFLLPIVLVFGSLFWGKILFGGDAPYFYPDTLKQLFSEPLVWTQRGYAFGGVNLALWLSPIMLIYGALGKFLHLGNDAIIRILFLFPSLALSFAGPYFLAKYLKFGKIVGFFASLVYVFNTYYLLLIDGGQVGVALAYGIFPLTLLFLKKFVDSPARKSFFPALLFSFLLSLADPRILVICLLVIFVWSLLEKKFTFWFLPLGLLLILLNFYWIYPLFNSGGGNVSTAVSGLGLLSLINPLFLFSPHWPANIFGKIAYPPFYFALVPLVIFGGLLFKNKDKKISVLALIFLFFAFISKGLTPPFGLNLGFVFRDSSKFFVPLTLFAGLLAGSSIELVSEKFKGRKYFSYVLYFIAYIYILFLIWPALFGRMNFLLSNHRADANYQKIAQTLSSQGGVFRTVWFTRRNPLSYESGQKPAIDAMELAGYRPFAQMNASEDVFNFLNNPGFVDWFKVLGIKYVFLNGDARNIHPDETDIRNWQTISDLVEKTPGLTKLDWGLDFPAYEITDPYPKFYPVERLVAVVGPELVPSAYSLVPSVYFEDGKWDPREIVGKNPDSIKIYFNGGDITDLVMSFLQKYFVSPSKNKSSRWAVFAPGDYLKSKYELLIRGYKYGDFDYGRGVAFSSQKGESITFKFNTPEAGDYILARRISDDKNQSFKWETEEKNLSKGSFDYSVTNGSGLQLLNVVALIPQKDYREAQGLAEGMIKNYGTVKNPDGKIASGNNGYWIIFSDNYSPFWQLKRGGDYFSPVPVYSMLNAFYKEPDWTNIKIVFKGQEAFRWGWWFSAATALSLTVICLYFKAAKK